MTLFVLATLPAYLLSVWLLLIAYTRLNVFDVKWRNLLNKNGIQAFMLNWFQPHIVWMKCDRIFCVYRPNLMLVGMKWRKSHNKQVYMYMDTFVFTLFPTQLDHVKRDRKFCLLCYMYNVLCLFTVCLIVLCICIDLT